MPIYSGCTVTIKLPPNYSKKDELAQVLASEFEGCGLNFEEDATIREPFADSASVSDSSPLSGARQSSEWTPVTGPFAPMQNVSGNILLRSAEEAIQRFLKEQRRNV